MKSTLVLVILQLTMLPAFSAETVLDSLGFESDNPGDKPSGWVEFTAGTQSSVTVVSLDEARSKRCLGGRRSKSGGWVALSKRLSAPQKRVMIEFSFAFSAGRGRSLNVWTHKPQGRDASQLNLCIQNGALQQYDGRTRTWEDITRNVRASESADKPVWHRLRAVVDADRPGIDFWVSPPGTFELPDKPLTRQVYRTNLPIGAIDMVSGTRIATDAWYLIDDLVVTGGEDLPPPHDPEPLPTPFELWSGLPVSNNVEAIPFVSSVQHRTIHRAEEDGYKFLHGAAIVEHNGVLYANWANSPINENGPQETLQGRRSYDQGVTWSALEVIGPGFDGPERHSHGVLFRHNGELWSICSRFGVGQSGRRFPGLKGEAFVLNSQSDRWESRGIVMKNCWPYDEPVRMGNGSYITGGQDRDGLPVVAISHGDDMTQWDSVLIPYDPRMKPSFAETTVCSEGDRVIAVIRGGGGVAWVSTSHDFGRTWSRAGPSNLPMPRAKAYLGRLSTGQLYLLSNLRNRDTLVISVSRPGEHTLSRMWRIRHGKSDPPRFPGRAKAKQWSYPYGHESNGRLFVVYSIGKEDCGLSVIPTAALKH